MENVSDKQGYTTTKTKWSVDQAHSEVAFKVRHMMITNVSGKITDFTVEALADEDNAFSNAEVIFRGKMASITTGNEQRDTHLKSADFFDVDNNAEVLFKSSRYTKNGDDITLEGHLTIRGETQPVTLDVEFNGIQIDPWGNTKAGFSVKGRINRKDFGLNWNAALETGGVLVGDEVKIECEIQMLKGQNP